MVNNSPQPCGLPTQWNKLWLEERRVRGQAGASLFGAVLLCACTVLDTKETTVREDMVWGKQYEQTSNSYLSK